MKNAIPRVDPLDDDEGDEDLDLGTMNEVETSRVRGELKRDREMARRARDDAKEAREQSDREAAQRRAARELEERKRLRANPANVGVPFLKAFFGPLCVLHWLGAVSAVTLVPMLISTVYWATTEPWGPDLRMRAMAVFAVAACIAGFAWYLLREYKRGSLQTKPHAFLDR